MSRWPTDARERLERAAIELFQEQGFAATTVPEITARAGLTTRTFHRHFADKREVLYAGADASGLATRLIADAPAGLPPLALIMEGLRTVVATRFEGRREDLRVRREIVRSDSGLRERDLQKWADMSAAIRAGFTARGIAAMRAALLADTAVSLLRVSLEEWLDHDDDRELFEIVRTGLDAMRTELAAG
ncbi:AcrR family transcriptional regulator [Actinoplanes tereljensis]|uniref:TetR family transcriptional regulator n=1 Tax=Paractinoplanes tereljensis TaxID=571912 RepID=A0A919TS46_9ACTN|nr:TetR/AcrR family transcriptional regulator [Actinoplanes tereljensis]GIF20151.1 TetR family transcriptional regulator [Actinoplanes tereljensis]